MWLLAWESLQLSEGGPGVGVDMDMIRAEVSSWDINVSITPLRLLCHALCLDLDLVFATNLVSAI